MTEEELRRAIVSPGGPCSSALPKKADTPARKIPASSPKAAIEGVRKYSPVRTGCNKMIKSKQQVRCIARKALLVPPESILRRKQRFDSAIKIADKIISCSPKFPSFVWILYCARNSYVNAFF